MKKLLLVVVSIIVTSLLVIIGRFGPPIYLWFLKGAGVEKIILDEEISTYIFLLGVSYILGCCLVGALMVFTWTYYTKDVETVLKQKWLWPIWWVMFIAEMLLILKVFVF